MVRTWIGSLATLMLVLAGALPAGAQSVAFLFEFGRAGTNPGEFDGPQDLAVDGSGNIVVADSFNHRIQVCDVSDRQNVTCQTFGSQGDGVGQFDTPSGVDVDGFGAIVVAERSNQRIQICDLSAFPTTCLTGRRPRGRSGTIHLS